MRGANPEPDNRIFWIVVGVVAAVIVLLTIIITVFMFNMNTQSSDIEGSESGNLNILSVQPPSVVDVAVTTEGTDFLLETTVDQYDSSLYKLGYSVEDQNRKTVASDVTTGTSFVSKVPVGQSGYYRIKVQLVDDDGKVSEWSEAYSVNVAETDAGAGEDPNPAYFNTGWANGEPGLQNLIEAVEVGYGAFYAAETENPIDPTYCVTLNSGPVSPKLLLPPVPAKHPIDIEVWFTVTDWDDANSTGTLTYWWC